jgi:two-component system sensor histidine kinase DctS
MSALFSATPPPSLSVRRLRWWLPALIFALLLAATLFLLTLSSTHESSQTQEQLITDTLWVKQTIQYQLDRHQETLQLLAADIAGRKLDNASVRARFESFLRNTKEALKVTYVNAALLPQVAVGREGGRVTVPDDQSDDMQAAIQRAGKLGQPVYGTTFAIDGGAAIALYVPIGGAEEAVRAKSAVSGYIIAIYSLGGMLDDNVPWWFAQENELTLSAIDERIRATRAVSGAGRGVYTHQTVMELSGANLMLRSNSRKGAPSWIPNALRGGIAVLTALLLLSLWALWRDIQRRVRAEEKLHDEAAFRKAMGDSVVTGLRARDMTGRMTYVNPAFCAMVGYDADELLGKVPPMPYWAPEYRDDYEERMAKILSGTVDRRAFETVFQRRNGERFPVMIYEAPLIDAYGKQTGWMSSIVDMTEQKHAEERTRQQHEKLQQVARLTTMGEMASSLAHELNQPLAAITSYITGTLNMMAAQGASPEEIQATLEKANQQAQRAGQVIRRVHDFVRKQEPDRSPIDLDEWIQDCLPLIELQARPDGVRLDVNVERGLPSLMGDAVLLQQVLLNITRNGIEAMSATERSRKRLDITARRDAIRDAGGGKSSDSTVDADRFGEMVRITVRDWGSGMAPDVREQLFTPFHTTKSEGMGMGLSICRTIIEAHGGRVTYDVFDDGTAFHVLLPSA